jgi:ribosomal-protein-alanine N-acetyltransferase
MGPFPIETDRLLLREFRMQDHPAIHSYASDKQVTLHTSWGPNDFDTTGTVLQQWLSDQEHWPRRSIPLGIELRSEGALIGSTGFSSIEGGTGIFGFVLHRHYWDSGIATEACQALVRFGFEELALHRVVAECFVEQVVSMRIFEKLGMRREAHFRKNALKAGEWRDTYLFALLKEEWSDKVQLAARGLR